MPSGRLCVAGATTAVIPDWAGGTVAPPNRLSARVGRSSGRRPPASRLHDPPNTRMPRVGRAGDDGPGRAISIGCALSARSRRSTSRDDVGSRSGCPPRRQGHTRSPTESAKVIESRTRTRSTCFASSPPPGSMNSMPGSTGSSTPPSQARSPKRPSDSCHRCSAPMTPTASPWPSGRPEPRRSRHDRRLTGHPRR